jgi:hypothetical protein
MLWKETKMTGEAVGGGVILVETGREAGRSQSVEREGDNIWSVKKKKKKKTPKATQTKNTLNLIEKVGDSLEHIGIGDNLLNRTPKELRH